MKESENRVVELYQALGNNEVIKAKFLAQIKYIDECNEDLKEKISEELKKIHLLNTTKK